MVTTNVENMLNIRLHNSPGLFYLHIFKLLMESNVMLSNNFASSKTAVIFKTSPEMFIFDYCFEVAPTGSAGLQHTDMSLIFFPLYRSCLTLPIGPGASVRVSPRINVVWSIRSEIVAAWLY